MSDHGAECVHHVGTKILGRYRESYLTHTKSTAAVDYVKVEEHDAPDDEKGQVIQMMTCRVCHEDDDVQNMENPCACSGTLKFAHRNCVQQWCDWKRDTMCEICHQPYQAGYVDSPHPLHSGTSGRSTMLRDLLDLHERLQHIIANLRLHEAELDDTNEEGTLLWPIHWWHVYLIARAVGSIIGPGHSFTCFMICLLLAIGVWIACSSAGLWAYRTGHRRRRRQVQEYLAVFELALTRMEGVLCDLQLITPPGPAGTSNW